MDVFGRLAPFIQDFIYANRWTELRAVQVAACEAIFNSGDNLLLSSGTASGKTEAAFLPILTLLHESPSASVGVLYISPLKALINDQFKRLELLIQESGIPVCKWHGDASPSKKNALLKHPAGILQITPESLESLLINRRGSCLKLFADLRFVIIDEVHHFMRDTRGIQVLCQLERLRRLTGVNPRRVGLSATLGDIDSAAQWLSTGSDRACQAPVCDEGKRSIRLFVQRFVRPRAGDIPAVSGGTPAVVAAAGSAAEAGGAGIDAGAAAAETDLTSSDAGAAAADTDLTSSNAGAAPPRAGEDPAETGDRAHFEYLFRMTLDKKTIIFTNSREETEFVIANLREIARREKAPDVYRVHHGNVSALLREQTEDEMKSSDERIVTGATVTLELGIDIGSLDQVVQIGAPITVASFAQRLGRCGRRGQIPQLLFTFVEDVQTTAADILGPINWDFVRLIAIIELYTRARWLEPLVAQRHPYALLYHQTMSILKSGGERTAGQLARDVLSLQSFRQISPADFETLLRHMIATGHLQQTDEGGLIIGRAGETVANHFQFYTVFTVPEYYLVKDENRAIGTVDKLYPVGMRFSLAGMTWETAEINEKAKVLFVKRVPGISVVDWDVDFDAEMHTVLVRKMKSILESDEVYAYLSPSSLERLREIRYLARNAGFLDRRVTPLAERRYAIFPWVGTRQLFTLHFLLRGRGVKSKMPWSSSVYLDVAFPGKAEDLELEIEMMMRSRPDLYKLPLPDDVQVLGKYNVFVPQELLRKQFIEDYLDFDRLLIEMGCAP